MIVNITLREAIIEFDSVNSKYFIERDFSVKAQEFFRCHDVAHVVFDCNTSILGEGKVKVWTIFGTTLGFWKHLHGYSEADAFSLFKKYSWGHILKNIAKLVITLPRIVIRTRHMKKPWPWCSYESFLDVSLKEIREKFGIRPL